MALEGILGGPWRSGSTSPRSSRSQAGSGKERRGSHGRSAAGAHLAEGTIVDHLRQVDRLQDQAAAHPLDDIATQDQAIGIFKASDSRTFLLAGATRNFGISSCQDDLGYAASDPAHNVATMFFAATQAIDEWYGARSWWQLQWHGMAVDSCTADVYMTHGVTTPPKATDKVAVLKQNILKYHPTWLVEIPGDSPSCSLNATTNVEGRFLNAVPVSSCCTTNATSYTQKFLSIEQDPNMRAASDWVQAVIDTWP